MALTWVVRDNQSDHSLGQLKKWAFILKLFGSESIYIQVIGTPGYKVQCDFAQPGHFGGFEGEHSTHLWLQAIC